MGEYRVLILITCEFQNHQKYRTSAGGRQANPRALRPCGRQRDGWHRTRHNSWTISGRVLHSLDTRPVTKKYKRAARCDGRLRFLTTSQTAPVTTPTSQTKHPAGRRRSARLHSPSHKSRCRHRGREHDRLTRQAGATMALRLTISPLPSTDVGGRCPRQINSATRSGRPRPTVATRVTRRSLLGCSARHASRAASAQAPRGDAALGAQVVDGEATLLRRLRNCDRLEAFDLREPASGLRGPPPTSSSRSSLGPSYTGAKNCPEKYSVLVRVGRRALSGLAVPAQSSRRRKRLWCSRRRRPRSRPGHPRWW